MLTQDREISSDLQRHVHLIARLGRLLEAAKWIIDETDHTLHEIQNNTDDMVIKNVSRKRKKDSE